MAEKETYQYNRGAIGVPSVLLALVWIMIWSLWPSFDVSGGGKSQRRPSRTKVSYGVVDESLYMSPLLFARATRVGFRAPEETSRNTDPMEHERAPNLRFLHVAPPEPDFGGMRKDAFDVGPVKQVDGYRPVWKDTEDFAATGNTKRVVVDVRGPLKARGYQSGPMNGPESGAELRGLEIEAFVGIDAAGMTEGVFLEKPSGDKVLDANVIRSLERGKASPGTGPVSGRVRVTIRRGDDSQN